MKKFSFYFICLYMLITGSFYFVGCKPSQKIENVTHSKPIEAPFSSKEYQNDEKYFRAKQTGNSPDMSTARKIALQNAKAELVGLIKEKIKRVDDQYTIQRKVTDQTQWKNKFQELIIGGVEQWLSDENIIGDKPYQESNGSYTYWIVIECKKDGIYKQVDSKLSNDDILKLDYDENKFKEIFDKEMKE